MKYGVHTIRGGDFGHVVDDTSTSMLGEKRQLVINEPVEVEDFRKIIDHLRGIYRIYPTLTKENRRM